MKIDPSPVSKVIVLFAAAYEKLSTPATGVVLAVVKRPSSSTVNTGIAVDEPYIPAVTPVFASSVSNAIVPDRSLFPVPVTFPVSVTVNPSSSAPSAAMSRPSTRPFTIMSLLTVRCSITAELATKFPESVWFGVSILPKTERLPAIICSATTMLFAVIVSSIATLPLTVKSWNSFIWVSNIPPSAVRIVNVLFAVVHSVLSTPAIGAVLAKVMRPSASTVSTGIAVDEPYVFAVTPVAVLVKLPQSK